MHILNSSNYVLYTHLWLRQVVSMILPCWLLVDDIYIQIYILEETFRWARNKQNNNERRNYEANTIESHIYSCSVLLSHMTSTSTFVHTRGTYRTHTYLCILILLWQHVNLNSRDIAHTKQKKRVKT